MTKVKRNTVSVIIVCWNNRTLLDECLGSLRQQSYGDFNVIMVDNGSKDGSVRYVRHNYPEVSVIEAGSNLGFAVANNIGIKRAFEDPDCRYAMLLNTDCTVRQDWLETMVAFADKHRDGASFQALTLDYYDHDIVDSCGIQIDQGGLATQMGYRLYGAVLKTGRVFGVNAAAALYSRGFLEAQPFGDNYFDSDLFMYLEDIDIAARAVMMGWSNYFVNQTEAYHMGSASTSKNPSFSLYMTYRNNLPVLLKNLPLKIIVRIFPGLMLAEYKRLRGLAGHHDWKSVRAILRGRIYSLPMLPKFLIKHYRLKKYWKVDLDHLWELMEHRHILQKTPLLGHEKVSVVVLSKNSPAVEDCIQALRQQHPDLNIIVVENRPSQSSVRKLKKLTNLIILPQKTDLGDANGFNTGIFYALNNQKPDFIGLIRAELRPTDGWLEILLKEFQSDRRIVMVGSEIKSFDRSWDDIANFWPFSKLNLDKLTRGEVIAVSDQACLIRSQVLRELGYFDGDFYQTLEDWDFGLRATLLGYKIIFQPKAKAEREQSEPQPSSIYWYLLIRNFNYLWIKNIPTPLAIRYWYEWFNLTFRLSLRAWGEGAWLSPFRAQLKTLVKLPRLIVWRSSIQRRRQLKLTELVKSNGREQ